MLTLASSLLMVLASAQQPDTETQKRWLASGESQQLTRLSPAWCLSWMSQQHLLSITSLIAGDMVTNSKPAPDIFLKAASSFEPAAAADNCLVFEDAPAGVTAGKAANM